MQNYNLSESCMKYEKSGADQNYVFNIKTIQYHLEF